MNRTLYYILLIFVSGVSAGFMMLSSFTFADPSDTVTAVEANKWYNVNLEGPSNNTYTVKYNEIPSSYAGVNPGSLIFGELGRLASFMHVYQSGSSIPPITMSGTHDIILSDTMGIISLYDLFTTYTIHAKSGEFRLDQITNGSFYIGKEKDGKIAIYAIDGVIRLDFLSAGSEMTNMILFPGSYIRFDPKRNASLKNVDLFRTILSLDNENNEAFEFVNPRVNAGQETDTFFNYRLPLETKVLFRALSARFHKEVEGVDILKQYGNASTYTIEGQSEFLYNPTKKNHFMLLEIKSLLAKVVSSKSTLDNVARISKLYNEAKDLKMEGSSAKQTIEQFLLDGRFSLYRTDTVEVGYQEAYESIARLIGIEPIGGKSKLLQNLADIYSGNLFLQAGKSTSIGIDTYGPTATSLIATLNESSIEKKDYFDIALYAYNILSKVQEKGILSREYLENKPTYDYLKTFFSAGSNYMSSIDDADKRVQTIQSFSSKFYDPILTMVVNSLYLLYMENDEGALFVKKTLVDNNQLKISPVVMGYIRDLKGVVKNVNQIIQSVADKSDDTRVYESIKRSTIRLEALSTLLDPKKYNDLYKDYVNAPYKIDEEALKNELILPQINEDNTGVVLFVPEVIVSEEVPTELVVDSKTRIAKDLFPEAEYSSFIPEGTYLQVIKAYAPIDRAGSLIESSWSTTLLDSSTLSQMTLYYGNRVINIVFPTQSITLNDFSIFRNVTLPKYLDIIDANSDVEGTVKIYVGAKRIDIGDAKSFNIQ